MSEDAPGLGGRWSQKRPTDATEDNKKQRTDSVDKYQSLLRQLVSDSPTPFAQSTWSDQKWQQLATLVDADVVTDAVSEETQRRVAEILAPLSVEFRKLPKNLARIQEKNSEDVATVAKNATVEPAQRKLVNFFRQVSDLCACRVKCSVTEISRIVNFLRFKGLSSVVYVRGSTDEKPLGSFFDVATQSVKDIVEYVYLYHPYVGHVVEIQIGEPFALLAFEINSVRRNGATLPKLFGPGLLYDPVKKFVLSPSTRTEEERVGLLVKVREQFQGEYRERLLESIVGINNSVVMFEKPAGFRDDLLPAAKLLRGCRLYEYLANFSHEELQYLLYFTPQNMLRPLFSEDYLFDADENELCEPLPFFLARMKNYRR
jgi:hypothetical protein